MVTCSRNFRFYAVLFLSTFYFFGCSSDEGDSSARFTIKTPPFPEIQEMAANTAVSLKIAGKVCPLTIDSSNWKLSGSCSGIPVGSHSFTLLYERSDLGVTIASANGNAALISGQIGNNITVTSLKKDQDDDGDRYTNLVEAMFGTDPISFASKPGIPPFSAIASYSTGSGPSAIVLGDLNKDTFLDVVTADGGGDTVTILLGNGDGILQPGSSFSSGLGGGEPLSPVDLSLAHLNPGAGPGEDDHLDILVINSGEGGTHPGSLSAFLGNGDGTFGPAQVNNSVGNQPIAIALGDLNGDGDPDVVTGNFSSKNLSVLLGGGDGTFSLAAAPAFSGDVTALTLGDLNGDTFLDLVVSTRTSLSYSVLLGIGDGSFGVPGTTTVGEIISVALQDLNADTRLDLITALSAQSIFFFGGNGDGSFQAQTLYKAGKTPGSLAFADLDNDGNLDLVTEDEEEGLVAILMGKGDGSFRSPVFFEAGTSPSWLALGDLNGDGGFDIVLTDRSTGSVNVLLTK